MRAAETKDQKFEAELEKVGLAGTIVQKSFQQRRISDPHHFNAELDPDLSFQFNADPTFT